MSEPARESAAEFLTPWMAYRCGKLEAGMAAAGAPIKRIETRRSLERQDYLWRLGRTLPGRIVTHAEPGTSSHTPDEHGLASAADYCFEGPEPFANHHPWALLGKMAEDLGMVWGGRFTRLKDLGHVEAPK